jgi:hypothetical protein
MRRKRSRRASIDEVMITRDGDTAVIEHADPAVSVTHFKIGPQIDSMSDAAILEFFNLTIEVQDELAAEYDNTVIEIPPGRPPDQIHRKQQSVDSKRTGTPLP